MKRLFLTLAAAAAVVVPAAGVATAASAQGRHYDRGYDNRGHDRDRDRDRGDWNRGHDNRNYGNRDWDRGRNNGYYLGSRFYYGPPPVAYYDRYDYRPGYSAWRRGGYLPSYYWGPDYVVYDYGRYGLRAPPRGYRWYNVNGDYVLAALAGGLIADALLH